MLREILDNSIKKQKLQFVAILLLTTMTVACGNDTPTFSLLPDENTFFQKGNEVNNKIDLLWVIDDSGSMETSQQNVADNFDAFMDKFIDKGYDFKMAVTTTQAYKSAFIGDPSYAEFKDGVPGNYTGIKVITKDTPDLKNTFLTNMLQGINGSGDERAFQSVKEALNSSLNTGFIRPDSFLAIIIVSDEDDFSHDGSGYKGGQYDYAGLHATDDYVDYLDAITSSSADKKRYNVNAVAIWDDACKDYLNSIWWGRLVGIRYGELVDATNGEKGDLCGDFAVELEKISSKIIQLSSQFFLSREPLVDTLQVIVNDIVVPNKDENPGPSVGGWTYNAEANSIIFYGDHIPEQGSTIIINFDPAGLIEE